MICTCLVARTCTGIKQRLAGSGSSGKSTALYSGGTRFESRPGHPKFFEGILTLLKRMSGQHRAMKVPFHILSNRGPYNPNLWTLCSLSYLQRISVHHTLVTRVHFNKVGFNSYSQTLISTFRVSGLPNQLYSEVVTIFTIFINIQRSAINHMLLIRFVLVAKDGATV